MTALSPTTEEPLVTLPTRLLLGSVVAASLATGGGIFLIAWALGKLDPYGTSGLVAATLVAVCTVAGLLAITPWKRRPMSLWMALWMGQTVVRLLVTPALTFLLYSATNLRPMPLTLAVGTTYLAAVVSEASVLARYLKRTPALASGHQSRPEGVA